MKTLLGRGIGTETGKAGEGSQRQPAEDMFWGEASQPLPRRGHLGTEAWMVGVLMVASPYRCNQS